ncbi:MAG: CHAT domain-containing protein [bacterium]
MNQLKLKLKTLGVGTVLFILSWILLALLINIPFIHALYETLETFIYFQIFTSTATPSEHLIIIDEQENEYERTVYAQLITELDRLGAKVIALDVLFSADRDLIQNAQLVAATRTASEKVIHAVEFLNYDNQAAIPDRFQFKVPDQPSPENYIADVQGATLPFNDLLEVTSHLGHVIRTSDITLHQAQYFPMIINYNNRLYPSLPLLTVMKFWGCRTDTLPKEPYEMIELIQNNTNGITHPIPINSKAQTLINFILKEKFAGKIFSIARAFELFENNSNIFQDKIILIGNSFDSQEQMHGPHLRSYPNLIIHGALISQFLNNENIREGVFESIVSSFILMILGIASLIFLSQKYDRVKPWHIYLISFLLLILVATITLKVRIKTYVILPYLVFLISTYLSKKYFEIRLKDQIGHKEKIKYLDYYLLIGPKREKDLTYPVFLIDCPAGEDFCELKFAKEESYYTKIREDMAQNLFIDISKMKEFGAALFEALFQPDIRDQYDKSLGMAFAQNASLRLKLRFDAPDLSCYPWEHMYDKKQTNEFLALHQKISITRFVSIPEPVEKVSLKPPLKILVIISNPDDDRFKKLDVEKEKKIIKKSLKNLERRGIVQLKNLKKPTLAALAKELRRKVDIIHFIGHGGYSESLGGCLVFENNQRGAELVNIDRLRKLLEGTPIRLVVLNACQTAETSASDISMGVAQGLVKIGVPAVIAMQFKISDESAILFSKEFYTTLADTFQVDRAVSEARRKIFINLEAGYIDWGIPVLFMRKDDGILYES